MKVRNILVFFLVAVGFFCFGIVFSTVRNAPEYSGNSNSKIFTVDELVDRSEEFEGAKVRVKAILSRHDGGGDYGVLSQDGFRSTILVTRIPLGFPSESVLGEKFSRPVEVEGTYHSKDQASGGILEPQKMCFFFVD